MGKTLLDPSLGVRVQSIPPMEMFTGNHRARRTPLDQFYYVALELGRTEEDRIFIDSARIALNPGDAGILYRLLRGYLMEVYGDAVGSEATIRIWESMGPVPRREVPQGQMFLAPGYFLIQGEKEQPPPKEHRH